MAIGLGRKTDLELKEGDTANLVALGRLIVIKTEDSAAEEQLQSWSMIHVTRE